MATDMSKFAVGTITERVDFADDLCLMKFKTDRELKYIPGQYATLAIERDGKLIQRPYSLVSAPHENELEIYFELVPVGEMTPLIWELKPNDTILIRQKVVGRFVLDVKAGIQNHLMAGTVTGGAPFIGMVRHQKKQLAEGTLKTPHNFLFIFGASRSWELGPYLDEMKEAVKDGWLSFHPTVSRPWDDEKWTGETGRVEEVLRKYGDAAGYTGGKAIGYACGHPDMIENVKGVLKRAGYPKEHIYEEKFFQE